MDWFFYDRDLCRERVKVVVATMCSYRCRLQKQLVVAMVENNANTELWPGSRVKTSKQT